uniref:Uncharacterized protein n=1 Tax=Opuntia streptacantha TaxID=393608 RepID=A0A7C9ACS9_OPUST
MPSIPLDPRDSCSKFLNPSKSCSRISPPIWLLLKSRDASDGNAHKCGSTLLSKWLPNKSRVLSFGRVDDSFRESFCEITWLIPFQLKYSSSRLLKASKAFNRITPPSWLSDR